MPIFVPVLALAVVAVLVLVGPDSFSAEAEGALNAVEGLTLAPPFTTSPVPPGTRVSQGFSNTHHAIDFAVAVGTPLKACADCVVAQVNRDPSNASGIFVIVKGRGAFSQIAWSYSHLSRPDVEVGDELGADDVVGLSGNTGESTGPHLHFAVLNTSFDFVDPRPFLLLTEGAS